MNTKTLVSAAAVLMLLVSQSGIAADGTINVTGAITDTTCTVLGVISDSDVGTRQPEINPVITLTNLSENSNAVTAINGFQIHLSGCYVRASQKNIRIKMSSPYAGSDGKLHNAIRDGAQGKVVVLYERSLGSGGGQFMPVGNGRSATAWSALSTSGDGLIRFGFTAVAQEAWQETATPGAFSTSVDYEMEYQ
ncbi:fimbrial protein [Klebsiella huaxiensis]|uniref:fimbrial protein n=1 Tax=Klebsiella huaxiensis TaxID=2153354 RepID=UPI003166CB89